MVDDRLLNLRGFDISGLELGEAGWPEYLIKDYLELRENLERALRAINDELGGGGGGDVSSVFGRTGAVVAEDDDYSVSQIAGLQDALDDKADVTDLDDKQDTLVSGTNIRTVNNQSLVGSGNVTITTPPLAPLTGTGSPEGVVTAAPGRFYVSDVNEIFLKATGTGNTGWLSTSAGPTLPTRNFNFFDRVNNYVTGTELVSRNGSSISGRVLLNPTTGTHYIFDGIGSSNRFFFLLDSAIPGQMQIANGTLSVDGGSGSVSDLFDGNIHEFEVTGITTAGLRIGNFGRRFNNVQFLGGFLYDLVFTNWDQGAVTGSNFSYPLDDLGGTAVEANGNGANWALTNWVAAERHIYEQSADGTRWNQTSPTNAALPDPLIIT